MGCALCLLGSVVIVLHAPPDKPVETIEEILHYALQPGMYNPDNTRRTTNIGSNRVSSLLPCCCDFLYCHDLPSCAGLRQKKSPHLYLHLFHRRLSLRHVR